MILPELERSRSPLVAEPEEDDGDEGVELERQDLLADGTLPLVSAAMVLLARSGAATLEEALEILEAWSPQEAAKHPRWPAGTPGGLGGHFMARGQRFALKGQLYDVDFGVPGGLYAHVATVGDISKAKHVFIPATVDKDGNTTIAGVTRPPVEPYQYANAKQETESINATVIDPYVEHDHDASIPIPADAPPTLTPARWQRFGRADQLRYVDLMHQFGKWSDSVAQTKVDAELAKQPSEMVSFLKQAYHTQFGGSSAFTIGLLQVFSGWFGGGKPSQAQLEKDRSRYEKLKQVQDAAARVIQWDLYNRVAAPDLTVFHKSHDTVGWWNNNIVSGKKAVFSGLSQTQRYQPEGFGPNGLASPVAIRNIVMATDVADIYKGHHYGGEHGEHEISIGEPMRMDKRSLAFADSSLDYAEQSALTNLTQAGTDGTTVDMLRARLEHGEPFPEIPVPPNLQMAGQSQWLAPPEAATKGIGKLGYADVDKDGVPIAKPAADLALKPGDYIEGMKGTRYIVVADHGSSYGVSYVKVTDSGTAMGAKKPYHGALHDASTGHQAYTGHVDWTGPAEHYEFQIELPFKKLAGHYDLPQQKAGVASFVPAAWAISGEKKKLKDFAPGEKFYLNGVPYEVTHPGAATVQVKSLTTGGAGTVAGGYLSNWLKLKQGYTEEGVPAFDPGEHFVGKPATLAELGLKTGDLFLAGQSGTSMAWQVTEAGALVKVVGVGSGNQGKTNELASTSVVGRLLTPKPVGWTPPQVGDTLAVGGKKGEVTKLLKGGVVQVNLHPGVVKIDPGDPVLAGVYSPGMHSLGPKMKLKDMQVGQKFHGGTGGKVKPYLVVGKGAKVEGKHGTFALVRNLDTGEETHVSYQKAFTTLLTQTQTAATPEASKANPAGLAEVYNPAAWVEGDKKPIHELKVGEKFSSALYGQSEVVSDKGAAWEVKALATGATFPVLKSGMEVATLEPNSVMPAIAFDPSAYSVTANPVSLGELHVGDIFVGTQKGKHYLVTKTGAKSGLTAIDLQTGNKSGPWKYDKTAPLLTPKGYGDAAGYTIEPGDPVSLAALQPGDQFSINGQLHQLIAEPAHGEDNATVAAVLPGGGLGFPGKVGWTPSLMVTWHLSADEAQEQAAKLAAAKAALTAKDSPYIDGIDAGLAAALAIDVKPYSSKSKSGGGYVFTLAKHAAEGTVLEDKKGNQFLVKSAGADPVVSNGSKNAQIHGEYNLKVVKGAAFVDNAPPLTQSGQAAVSNLWAGVPPLTTNFGAAHKTLGELGLKAGDFYVSNGDAYKVQIAYSTGGVMSKNVETHTPATHGAAFVPTSYAKVGAPEPLPEPPAGELAPTLHVPIPPEGGFIDNSLVKLTLSQTQPGSFFKSSFGDTMLWHGAVPWTDGWGMGYAEFVTGPHAGKFMLMSLGFVPSAIGPEHPLEVADFEQGEKVLMSQLKPGDVYSAVPGKGVAKVLDGQPAVLGGPASVLNVVASAPGKPQSAPYTVPLTPGTPVWKMVAKAAPAGPLVPATWTDNPEGLSVAELPVGAKFVAGASDVYTVKAADGKNVMVTKNEGEGSPHESGPQPWDGHPGWVPAQIALPPKPVAASPGDYTETDEYMVQKVVDAWASNDTAGFHKAQDELASYLDLVPVKGDELEKFVNGVVAARGLTGPDGEPAFAGVGYVFDTLTQEKYDTPISDLSVEDEFETTNGDKWIVTDVDEVNGHLTAAPIGMEGEGLEQQFGFGQHVVHVLSADAPAPAGKLVYLYAQPVGAHVYLDGNAYTVKSSDQTTTQKHVELAAPPWASYGDETVDPGTIVTVTPAVEGQTAAEKGMTWDSNLGPDSEKKKLGEMPVGTHVKSPFSGAEFEVVGHNPTKLKAVTTTEAHPAGEVFEHTPEWTPPFALPPDREGNYGPIDFLNQAEVGDHVQAPLAGKDTPAVWKVVAKIPDSGMVSLEIAKSGHYETGEAYGLEPGGKYEADGGHGPWNIVPPPEEVTVLPDPLKPYSAKSKTGGGYSFADLGDLIPGAKFTDKTGTVYEVVSKSKFNVQHKAVESGQLYSSSKGLRVKLVF